MHSCRQGLVSVVTLPHALAQELDESLRLGGQQACFGDRIDRNRCSLPLRQHAAQPSARHILGDNFLRQYDDAQIERGEATHHPDTVEAAADRDLDRFVFGIDQAAVATIGNRISSTEVQDAAEGVVRPFQQAVGSAAAAYPESALFDQLLLFPMKLGLSIALASTAMLASPIAMTKRLQTTGISR